MIVRKFKKRLRFDECLMYRDGRLLVNKQFNKECIYLFDPFTRELVGSHKLVYDVFKQMSWIEGTSQCITAGVVGGGGVNDCWAWDGTAYCSWSHLCPNLRVAASLHHVITTKHRGEHLLCDRGGRTVCQLPCMESFDLGASRGAALEGVEFTAGGRYKTGMVFRFDGTMIRYNLPFSCNASVISDDELTVTFANKTKAVTFDLD